MRQANTQLLGDVVGAYLQPPRSSPQLSMLLPPSTHPASSKWLSPSENTRYPDAVAHGHRQPQSQPSGTTQQVPDEPAGTVNASQATATSSRNAEPIHHVESSESPESIILYKNLIKTAKNFKSGMPLSIAADSTGLSNSICRTDLYRYFNKNSEDGFSENGRAVAFGVKSKNSHKSKKELFTAEQITALGSAILNDPHRSTRKALTSIGCSGHQLDVNATRRARKLIDKKAHDGLSKAGRKASLKLSENFGHGITPEKIRTTAEFFKKSNSFLAAYSATGLSEHVGTRKVRSWCDPEAPDALSELGRKVVSGEEPAFTRNVRAKSDFTTRELDLVSQMLKNNHSLSIRAALDSIGRSDFPVRTVEYWVDRMAPDALTQAGRNTRVRRAPL